MPRKRTPIEQLIAVQTDRRAKWEAARTADGYRRVSWWVPGDLREPLRALLAAYEAGDQESRLALIAACSALCGKQPA